MKRRLLFLSFYYQPDLCAGSFRATAIVNELARQAADSWDIDVVTTMPNRYITFSSPASRHETKDAVNIHRISLPEHQSGMYDQSLAFLKFAGEVKSHIKGNRYDAVFATSSRLATAVLGARIANRLHKPLYLDIRDIFAETLDEVLARSPLKLLLPLIKQAEKYAVKSANRINVVSEGFLPYFQEKGLRNNFSFFPNGIDDEFLSNSFRKETENSSPKVLLYAGNIGDGQGLHKIVPGLGQALNDDWLVRIVGDGGKRKDLEIDLQKKQVSNVEISNPVSRDALMDQYRQADVLFLHLNDYEAFKRVLPSKIFEYAATGKPLLAGVGGYAADFLKNNVSNASVFKPCDVNAGINALKSLDLNHITRSDFVDKYSRKIITEKMVKDILKTFEAAP